MIEFAPELVPRGLYHVGDKIFNSKLQALLYSDQTGSIPRWDFHDDWFSKFDWTIEPDQTLESLYAMRCQQIRDKYDYLVLHYSGGSDSHNMLTFFYLNNIHVDEILVAWPISYFENHTKPGLDKSAAHSHNEWFHVVKPDLEWIRKNLPKTKITLYDYTDDMVNFNVDQDWILHAGEHINPNITNRIQRYYQISDINLYDRHKIGHLYGIDKPLVFKEGSNWYLSFLDSMIGIQASHKPIFDRHTHINVEFFYWSPDLPLLLIKQAHMIKKYYDLHPESLHLATFKKKTLALKEQERDLSRSVVYPHWRKSIFQTHKASNMFYKEFDSWFFQHATDSAKSRWHEGLDFLIGSLDKKWISHDKNGVPSGLAGFYSQWHRFA